MGRVNCSICGKEYFKDTRHMNENLKFGHKFYCSSSCQSIGKNKKIEMICSNSSCNNRFRRIPAHISAHNFCSRSCAVSVNNVKFPKIEAVIRKCNYCSKELTKYRKYCSVKCKSAYLTISKDKVVEHIRKFYEEYGRIPVKREIWGIYKPSRKYFGTWNNAILAAGFDLNPVMFAKHHIAKDGHKCDSLAEKIIDDYLFRHDVQHEHCIPYPGSECTADFKIGEKWIEYFGLAGEHKRYDQLRRQKQKIAKKYNLYLIEIYPKDLFKNKELGNLLGV